MATSACSCIAHAPRSVRCSSRISGDPHEHARSRSTDVPPDRRARHRLSGRAAAARRAHPLRAAPRLLRLVQGLPRADAADDRARRQGGRGVPGAQGARGPGPPVPRLEGQEVIAFKWLARGAIAPFTGFRWPTDGPWVSIPSGVPEGAGVHACRISQLAYWIGEELWRIELDGPIVTR